MHEDRGAAAVGVVGDVLGAGVWFAGVVGCAACGDGFASAVLLVGGELDVDGVVAVVVEFGGEEGGCWEGEEEGHVDGEDDWFCLSARLASVGRLRTYSSLSWLLLCFRSSSVGSRD